MIPVEFIFRGYLTGSLFQKFYSKGLPNPYGVNLEPGLKAMSPFSEPIFTPTDKSETDEPLNTEETIRCHSEATGALFKVFKLVRNHLRGIGLELVDSKFEVVWMNQAQLHWAMKSQRLTAVVSADSPRSDWAGTLLA